MRVQQCGEGLGGRERPFLLSLQSSYTDPHADPGTRTTLPQLNKVTHTTLAHTAHSTKMCAAHVHKLIHIKTVTTDTHHIDPHSNPGTHTTMFPTTDRHACQNSHTRTILVIDINPETDTQLHTDMHETHSNQSHTETKTYNHKPQTDRH